MGRKNSLQSLTQFIIGHTVGEKISPLAGQAGGGGKVNMRIFELLIITRLLNSSDWTRVSSKEMPFIIDAFSCHSKAKFQKTKNFAL